MQAQIESQNHKFNFFKDKKNKTNKNVVFFLYSIVLFPVVLGTLWFLTPKTSPAPNLQPKTSEIIKKESTVVEQSLDIFKYLSKLDNTKNHEDFKKELPNYKVTFEEYKILTGFIQKDKTFIYFSIDESTWYVSFSSMTLEDAYKLQTAFDSLAINYKLNIKLRKILGENTVDLILTKEFAKPVIEMPILAPKSSAQIDQELKDIMKILPPIMPMPKKTQAQKLLEDLDTIKIKNLILTEQIKQNELLKKFQKTH